MTINRFALLIAVLLLVAATPSRAQDDPAADLLIYNVWLRPTAPIPLEGATPEPPLPGAVTGAFMSIENVGERDYRLVSVTADFAGTSEIHETTMGDGMMHMNAIDELLILAGETVLLESGGYHAMLMDVTEDVYPDDVVKLTLTFEDMDDKTFDVVAGALVTDFPPEADTVIAANATAHVIDPSMAQVFMTLINRGEVDEALIGISNDRATTAEIYTELEPVDSLDVPAGEATTLVLDQTYIRLGGLRGTLGAVFALELTFASGKSLIVPVVVTEAAAD